jgi:hypothetical protein
LQGDSIAVFLKLMVKAKLFVSLPILAVDKTPILNLIA